MKTLPTPLIDAVLHNDLRNTHTAECFADAKRNLLRGLQTGEIFNADFHDVKRHVNYAIEAALG